MIVLHAGVDSETLFIWAETPGPQSPSADGPNSAPSAPLAHPTPVAHPGDAGVARLVWALVGAIPGMTLSGDIGDRFTLWLPSVAGVPLPSGPLLGAWPSTNELAQLSKGTNKRNAKTPPTQLAPWQVTGIRLTPGQTVDLLCSCLGRDTLGGGVLIGPTLSYWSLVLRFAAALVAREAFVPGVRPLVGLAHSSNASAGDASNPQSSGALWQAVWQPLLLGPDVRRLADLARRLPPACRAVGTAVGTANGNGTTYTSTSSTSSTSSAASAAGNPEEPPVRAPLSVVESVLRLLVDHLVRAAVAEVHVHRPGTTFPSLHDQWLQALRGADSSCAVLRGEEHELTELVEQSRSWQRPLTVSTNAPFQLCFRLEAPTVPSSELEQETTFEREGASDDKDWYVRYLLQAKEDPSLLIPVGQAWHTEKAGNNDSSSLLARFETRQFRPREYLLTTLGQAAALCPPIERSLKSPTPAGFSTDATGAHRFLQESAWLLERAGFGIQVPAWWTRRGTATRLTVQAEVQSPKRSNAPGSGLSLTQMISFDWKVALGAVPVTLEELEELARLKAPLVRFRGQWIQVDSSELRTAIDLLQRRAGGEAPLREVIHMALGSGQGPGGLPFSGVTARGWLSDLLAQLEGKEPFAELPLPEGFQGSLRPYQLRGFSWLAFLRRWGLGACLADDMGLGKTIQTLALLQRDWPLTQRPTLLICPTSVVGNWKKEAQRFTPELPVHVHHGGGRVKGKAFADRVARQALVISSYALLFRDRELLSKVDWAGVVLDEAQNIKNSQTKQAQAARALKAEFRIALTGTPVENHVGDLWSILDFLNPGLLGSPADFRRRFFIPIQAQHDPEATQQLKRLAGPFILRRLKSDRSVIADLPEKMEMKVYCTLTKEQATLYAAVVAELERGLQQAEGLQRHGLILGTLLKLKQVCNHPAHFLGDQSPIPERSGKLARLTEMLEEVLEAGDKALVFTQFTEMGEILKKHLQENLGREVLFLHGGISRTARERMVERFQNPSSQNASSRASYSTLRGSSDPPIFLLSLKAGGTGLNLTAANHVFHYDRWWNPAVEDQATDRAFRIGQTRNVQVHKFVCVGTLEEKIDDMIERKQQVAKQVVSTGEAWLTELTNEQLHELLTLRREAVGDD